MEFICNGAQYLFFCEGVEDAAQAGLEYTEFEASLGYKQDTVLPFL